MQDELKLVKTGLLLVMLTLIFGLGLGIGFGVAEDSVKDFIAEGIQAHPLVHDEKSSAKIWRYAQRAHFHATGIAAFSIGLIVLVMFSSLKKPFKKCVSILIGVGGLYPLAWFSMFLLAPSIGRSAAHHHLVTQILTYCGVVGLLVGILVLSANLFLGRFKEDEL